MSNQSAFQDENRLASYRNPQTKDTPIKERTNKNRNSIARRHRNGGEGRPRLVDVQHGCTGQVLQKGLEVFVVPARDEGHESVGNLIEPSLDLLPRDASEDDPHVDPDPLDVIGRHLEDHPVFKEEVFDKPPLVDNDEVLEFAVQPVVGRPTV